MNQSPRLLLGTLLAANGLHLAGWRHSTVQPRLTRSLAHYNEQARLAEQACLDFLFLADSLAVMYAGQPDALPRIPPLSDFEPMTLLAALAAGTREIGLIGSITTTYNEPFHVARQLASLDLLSEGRAGWNVVTSFNPDEAGNFGQTEHAPLAERYERATEFVDVVQRLWNSWEPDALLFDQHSGRYFDPAKVHAVEHRGRHFSVHGPLTMPHPPQSRPVLVQSGSSELGRATGAGFADLIFTAQQEVTQARAFRASVHELAAAAGRRSAPRVLPGIVPVVASTRSEAEDLMASLQAGIHPDVGLSLLSSLLGGVDLRPYDIDGPLPELPATQSQRGRVELLRDTARAEGLSIRQLYERAAGGARGHWTQVGSATDVADAIEEWFITGAADGFSLIPSHLPASLQASVQWLVPELQRRGLLKTSYAAGTLREKLELD